MADRLATDENEREAPSIPRRAITEATRSLSALLVAGLPLTRALETTRDVVRGDLAGVLDAVLEEVKSGTSFGHALSMQDGVFSPLYVGVVRAGERSGRLASITERLADELERQDELRERIVSASIYPAALVTIGGISLLLLLLLVVPRFAELLRDAGAELPATTAGLLSVSSFLQAHWSYLVLGVGLTSLCLAVYLQSPDGRALVSRSVLHLPVLGSVRRELLAARFSRLLSVLMDGGAPVVVGLSDAAESLGDPVAAAEVRRIREEVRIGTALAPSIGAGALFPEELARLVAVGEESGRVSEFLSRAADFFERRSVRAMERAVTILEPVVIVFFGALVALVALALLQAIYGVNAGAFS